MRLVYVIGMPGAGKTTATRLALGHWARVAVTRPFAHDVLIDTATARTVGAHLGAERSVFGGTDSLAMDVQPKVLGWLAEQPYPLIVGEGDRLANVGFLNEAARYGSLDVVHLAVHEDVAAARRASRGTTQHPTWVAGRITKVHRLARRATHVIDANQPEAAVAAELRAVLAGQGAYV